MNSKIITVFDSTDVRSYDDYVEDCEANDVEPQGEDSSDYWNWVAEMCTFDTENFFSNIGDMFTNADEDCLIEGNLGLWNGHPTVVPVHEECLEDAIKKCIGNCDDFSVSFDGNNKCIYVEGYHHDGTNSFMIHPLSSKGRDIVYQREYDGDDITEPKPYWYKKYNFFKYKTAKDND